VLYQLLTDKRPFDGDTDFSTIQQIVGHTPAAPSTLQPQAAAALDAVVAKALAKSRDQRLPARRTSWHRAAGRGPRGGRHHGVAAAVPPGPGTNSTWTSTLLAGEALVDLQSGTSANISVVTQELELVYWKDIKESMDVEDIQGFLVKFPSGIYADLARRRLKKWACRAGRTRTSAGAWAPARLIVPRPGASRRAAWGISGPARPRRPTWPGRRWKRPRRRRRCRPPCRPCPPRTTRMPRAWVRRWLLPAAQPVAGSA
jgi:hypothetical protein